MVDSGLNSGKNDNSTEQLSSVQAIFNNHSQLESWQA